jgi:hypothetical protein
MRHASERRGKCIGFWWESQKERPLRRQMHRWEDGIRMDLREIGWGSVEWIQLVQEWGPVACFFEYGDEPVCSGAMELVSLLLLNMS